MFVTLELTMQLNIKFIIKYMYLVQLTLVNRVETLLKILGAKWAPKFWYSGAHFNFQGPTYFEYRFA